ncbi:MAG: glutamyl-tRNA amidotransferase [Roseiflexus castenholzii]|nr:MAG: glutamyl-tRNA amidotransferase [Roseiflexus castenholzii]
MAILEQLQNDLKAALKSGDRLRVETIRMAIDALKKAQMAQVKAAFDAAGGESADTGEIDRHAILTEAAEQEVLTKEVKRRREAAELYRKGGRTDLAEKEEAEAAILQAYLPQQLSEEELRPLVKAIIDEIGAAGPADMGRVMPVLMQRLKGRADGRLISQMARDLLSHAL